MNSEANLSNSCQSGSLNGEGASNSDGSDFSRQILNYMGSMLTEDKSCLLYDPSVLEATEKSLHKAVIRGEKHPALPNQATNVCENALSTKVLFLGAGHDCGNSSGIGNIGFTEGLGQYHYQRVGSNQIKHSPLNLDCVDRSFLLPNQGLGNLIPFNTMNSKANLSDSCQSGSLNGEGASNSDGSDFSRQILKYIGSMFTKDKSCLLYDPSVLEATEKSLHEAIVLNEKHPALPNQASNVCENALSTNVLFPGTGHDCSNSSGISNIGFTDNSRGKQTLADNRENRGSTFLVSPSSDCFYQSTDLPASRLSSSHPKGRADYANKILASPASEFSVQYDSRRALPCKRGHEEANQFLSEGIAGIDAADDGNMSVAMKKSGPKVGIDEKEQQGPFYSLRGSKNHGREELCESEGKFNKKLAASMKEIEISEMFDRILLCNKEPEPFTCTDGKTSNAAVRTLSPVAHARGSSGHKNRAKKAKNSEDMVDLRNLLILCAEAISTGDRRSAGNLLKQIRLHSSPTGDACQRVAHAFADALDARLAGTTVQNMFAYLSQKRMPIGEILKTYQTLNEACPFNMIAIVFANNMISKVAETAKTLHIIDFGILLGFQWPLLIQLLSRRPGGPPKLRVTGIELPQHGFKTEERIMEVGCHLAKYCERFGVPFEYNPIVSQHWENIKVEEMKIGRNEVIAVNCLYRFESLLDETVVVSNPRDAVLKLIRDMRPDIFVLSVVNGTFNSPFFIPRFRQALFHFSALYDMFDCNVSRDNNHRLLIEREYYKQQITNVIACEGSERVERPETYKQWHTRISQARFKQRPLDKKLVKTFTDKLEEYHEDLVILEDGNWMLQGWKGRILYASSSWERA